MGTTAEKGARVLQSITEVQQGINNLGGSLTDQTPFKDFKAQLDNIYDNLPKTEYQEGTEVTLENTLKGKLNFDDGKVGFGQASQESTSGTNLANTTGYIAPTTNHGVTYSLKDNEISLNGTCDTAFYINFPGKFEMKSGDYTFAIADVSGTYTGTCGKYPAVNGSNVFDGNHLSNVANRSIDTDYTNVYIRLFVAQGCAFTNFKCKFNLVKGTYTAQTIPTWEEYSNGYASPSPNYAQEVECVAGINICDKDNEIRIGGTTSPLDTTRLSIGLAKKLKANTTYTIVTSLNLSSFHYAFVLGKTPSPWMIANQLFDSGWISNTNHYSVTTPEGCYLNIPIRKTDNTEIAISDVNNYWFMVYEGEYNSSIPYTPYNTIQETISGKNLANWNLPQNITTSGNKNLSSIPQIEIGEKYYFYGKCSDGTRLGVSNCACVWATSNTQILNVSPNATFTGTDISNATQFYVYLTNTVVGKTITEFMLIKGEYDSSNLPTYEPYITPTTYQLSLGNNKFYGIGTYRDYILRTTGKNLFDNDVEQGSVNGYEGRTYENCKYNSNTRLRTKNLISLDKNKTYTISCDSNYRIMIQAFNDSQLLYTTTGSNAWASSITFTNIPYISITIKKVSEAEITPQEVSNAKVMLEIGSTATDYEPYGVGNWYKVGRIGEKIFTGASSEGWRAEASYSRFSSTSAITDYDVNNRGNSLCNYYKYNGTPYFAMSGQGSYVYFGFPNENITTKETWEAWLSTHNVSVVYILANPTITPITGTLAEQLEAWYNAHSNNGTTIITSYGNLPMIIKVRGLKGE